MHKGIRVHYFGKKGFLNKDVACDLESWFTDTEMDWFFDAISGATDGLEDRDIPIAFHHFFEAELKDHITWIPKTPESVYTITYPPLKEL